MKLAGWILPAFALGFAGVTLWFFLAADPEPTSAGPQSGLPSAGQMPASAPPGISEPAVARAAIPVGRDPASAKEAFDAILREDGVANETRVSRLFLVIPDLPPGLRAEAARQIALLSNDRIAAAWVGRIVDNTLPEPVLEVLYDDLLDRSHTLVLPALAAMADRDNHPKSPDSTEILDLLFGPPEPAGKRWQDWVGEQIGGAEDGER